ncbi:MAG TPA: DUF6787 family protein [Candidatus Krumholzibacteria bacterium]|nr:DUF6787 family protein [Candidatus Krumholzibacteria bacterium]
MKDTEHAEATAPARPGAWARLRQRWGVSNRGVVVILLAFSLAGLSTLKIGRPIVHMIVPHDAPGWHYWPVKLLVVLPIYEVLLLCWGTLLGQGRFFRRKLRGTLRFLWRPFRRRGRDGARPAGP